MAVLSTTVAVTDTRIAIPVPAPGDYSDGAFLELTNASTSDGVRIGGPTVTFASGGTLVGPDGTWYSQGELRYRYDTLYAVCDTGRTATLNILWTKL
jgi:hypothetical protein